MPKNPSTKPSKKTQPSSAPQLVKAEDLDLKKLSFADTYVKDKESPYASLALLFNSSRLLLRFEGKIVFRREGKGPLTVSILPSSSKAAGKLEVVAALYENRENIKNHDGDIWGEIEKSYEACWTTKTDGTAFTVLVGKHDSEELKYGAVVRVLVDVSLSVNKETKTANTQFWARGFKILKEAVEEEEVDIAAMLDD